MTPIKVLATIFAFAVLAKLTFLIVKPDLWMGFVGVFLKNYTMTIIIYLALAAIVGYFILTSISITDVAAVMLFTSLLIGIALVPYSTSLLKIAEEAMSTGLGKAWISMVIWGSLALWVLYAVFAKKT